MEKYMYSIIYILFKHVKLQYNNLLKYNSQYSVCVAISQGLNNFFLDLSVISLLIRTLFNILTWEDSCLDGAWQKKFGLRVLMHEFLL